MANEKEVGHDTVAALQKVGDVYWRDDGYGIGFYRMLGLKDDLKADVYPDRRIVKRQIDLNI